MSGRFALFAGPEELARAFGVSIEDVALPPRYNVAPTQTVPVVRATDGRRQGWTPIPMRIIREDEGQTLHESDSPWLGSHALVFKARAVEALGPLLREYGELLPLLCGGSEVWMYNPTRVLDALDEQASAVVRFSSGRIMAIDRHVFRPDVVRDVAIFKIPNLRASPTFVGEEFVGRWEAASLKGLEFEEVWRPT